MRVPLRAAVVWARAVSRHKPKVSNSPESFMADRGASRLVLCL